MSTAHRTNYSRNAAASNAAAGNAAASNTAASKAAAGNAAAGNAAAGNAQAPQAYPLTFTRSLRIRTLAAASRDRLQKARRCAEMIASEDRPVTLSKRAEPTPNTFTEVAMSSRIPTS